MNTTQAGRCKGKVGKQKTHYFAGLKEVSSKEGVVCVSLSYIWRVQLIDRTSINYTLQYL